MSTWVWKTQDTTTNPTTASKLTCTCESARLAAVVVACVKLSLPRISFSLSRGDMTGPRLRKCSDLSAVSVHTLVCGLADLKVASIRGIIKEGGK